MKLAPLKDYRGPGYPTQEILDQHPELLRVLPRRWHNNPLVLGALAGLLGLMEQSLARADENKPALRVAPIFEHGKGQGAFGCVVANPPVFLTEAEAREVIEEEAKKAGVEFPERGHKLGSVPVPFLERYVVWEDPKPSPITTSTDSNGGRVWHKFWTSRLEDRYQKKTPEQSREVFRDVVVELTGWSSLKQVGYRFVNREDLEGRVRDPIISNYEKLPDSTLKIISSCSASLSTVSDYDMRGGAQRLVRGLGKVKEFGYVGVFYDPLSEGSKDLPFPFSRLHSMQPKEGKTLTAEEQKACEEEDRKVLDEYRTKYEAAGRAASVEELRLQVRDYLAWLKAQGVI